MGEFILCNFLKSSQFRNLFYYQFPSILGTFEISLRALWWPLVKEIRKAYLIYLLDWFLTASASSNIWLAFKCSSLALKSWDNLSIKNQIHTCYYQQANQETNLSWIHFPFNAKNWKKKLFVPHNSKQNVQLIWLVFIHIWCLVGS